MEPAKTTSAVIGLGKLGTPLLACLASRGFNAYGWDVNSEAMDCIRDGREPPGVCETGLANLLPQVSDHINVQSDMATTVRAADVIFVVVPTPTGFNGQFSTERVQEVAAAIALYLDDEKYRTIVLVSTVMPGQTRKDFAAVIAANTEATNYGVCYNPEFISLGNVIRDLLHPDFILIGGEDEPTSRLSEFYAAFLCDSVPVSTMSFENAELAKLSLNCFVTMKVSFANSLATLCEKIPGGNVDAVTQAIGQDSRIGPKYLTAGTAYGGPCFPRDNNALGFFGINKGVGMSLVRETHNVNEEEMTRLVKLVIASLPAKDSVTCILGAAYKLGTHLDTEAAGTRLFYGLTSKGYFAMLDTEGQRQALVDSADVVVLALPDERYKSLNYKDKLVIDCWRLLIDDPPHYHIPLGIGPEVGQ